MFISCFLSMPYYITLFILFFLVSCPLNVRQWCELMRNVASDHFHHIPFGIYKRTKRVQIFNRKCFVHLFLFLPFLFDGRQWVVYFCLLILLFFACHFIFFIGVYRPFGRQHPNNVPVVMWIIAKFHVIVWTHSRKWTTQK